MVVKLLRWLCSVFYRVEVKGIENFNTGNKRKLIIANHTSYLDAVLMAVFLPGEFSFAIHTRVIDRWYMLPFRYMVKLFVMDPANPFSIKSLIRYLKEDHSVVIFPEGRITVTGSLMKIYNGPGLVADRADAGVVPVRIEGAQYTPFSRLRGRIRIRWFPKITLTVLPPRTIKAPAHIRGRARRSYAGQKLSDIMSEMMFATSNYQRTLFQAILDARRTHGSKHIVVEDIEREPLNYQSLISRSFILGDALKKDSRRGEVVGVLLPNTVGTVTTFLALQAHNRVPAMLNFSTGAKGMLSACETARIKTIYTSRRFIRYARMQKVIDLLGESVRIVYLEDVVKKLSILQKLRGLIAGFFAQSAYYKRAGHVSADGPAVVLFTSGSEGVPKGVVLSHENLLANNAQMATRIDFNAQDIILNALPMFHSFGLTAGTILPLTYGMRTFFYPTPLHYRIIPEIAYDVAATIMFGTNTFLAGYARFAHPYDFYSVRYVFAGAEKLHESTRKLWSEKFGVRVFEGYGATETSPALSSNTAMDYMPGTVGRFLPGVEYHLEDVPGVDEGGRLYVKGPNVMLGYYLNDLPGVLQAPQTSKGRGWYDTGDIVSIDEEGFIKIKGRAKRFAKVGGEMVSLTAVEALANKTWPGSEHAVVTMPDAQKGEQLVLVTNEAEAKRAELLTMARSDGVGEISVPRKILVMKKLPLLGTGKIDYPAVQEYVAVELA